MIPLKPPKLKLSKNFKKEVHMLNLPFVNDYGKLSYDTEKPMYHGVFNGKVVIINSSMDQTRLINLGAYGQYGVFDNNTFIDYKTLQNQALKQKKKYHAMELVPFEFPENKCVENILLQTNSEEDGKSSEAVDVTRQIEPQTLPCLQNTSNFCSQKPTCIKGFKNEPKNWKELKTKYSSKYEELLIKSGVKDEVPYFLFLEEAFFLFYTLECLEIRRENSFALGELECWKIFNGLKKNFPYFYAAFHYYKSKDWVVKPGHQFGGDFVLYKLTPLAYHSSYVVVISINGQNSELLSSWPSWFGCDRAVEAVSKNLLICTVHGPDYKEGMPVDLTQYTVNDTIVRRWVPSQNRVKPQEHDYE